MRKQLVIAAVVGMSAWMLAEASASAADGSGCVGYNYVWANGQFGTGALSTRENVPYFALHPPVYYSYPVPRPYGFSPFPYPAWILTPEVLAPQPVTIQNRYVPREPAPVAPPDRQAVAPLRIVNPYVEQPATPQEPESPGLASLEPSRPQVVYPASLE